MSRPASTPRTDTEPGEPRLPIRKWRRGAEARVQVPSVLFDPADLTQLLRALERMCAA